ncbi:MULTISPECIES: hypothetical protein [unclassified Mycobacterium]|uniref:hypothetical protein n=1 Tax=unclassified Mycobacterium TaxID=2642494 RepID=UPI002742446A|nr:MULTISPECIES: hypothetical protein [unclassified Mycobacterium]MDP7706144.1 hypothetical protein [Mycobacterium sp. TY815]MDP7726085.1 hypothetical protein [Mycobacterium sp. TY814]
MSNRILGPLMILLIGLGLMAFGSYYAFRTVVECDNKVMHSGDSCRQRRQPTKTYEEKRDSDHTIGWVVLGVGSAMAIAGIGLGISAAVRRPASPGFMPPGGPGSHPPRGAAPWYPPPPGGQLYYPPPQYPPQSPPWPQR